MFLTSYFIYHFKKSVNLVFFSSTRINKLETTPLKGRNYDNKLVRTH